MDSKSAEPIAPSTLWHCRLRSLKLRGGAGVNSRKDGELESS